MTELWVYDGCEMEPPAHVNTFYRVRDGEVFTRAEEESGDDWYASVDQWGYHCFQCILRKSDGPGSFREVQEG